MKKLWLALLPLPALAAPPQYTVRDLGLTRQPGGGLYWRMNESTAASNLPSLGGDPAKGNVNADYIDFAVGDSPLGPNVSPPAQHAVFWTLSYPVTVTDLGTLGSYPSQGSMTSPFFGPDSTAYAANNLEEIVGVSDSGFPSGLPSIPAHHAVLWTNVQSSDRSIHDLSSLAGDFYSSLARGVNDSHEIVGWTNTIASADGSVLQRAFLYAGGTMYNLSFYLVNAPSIRLTDALAINCQGDIAATGYDLNRTTSPYPERSYVLIRQGTPRKCP